MPTKRASVLPYVCRGYFGLTWCQMSASPRPHRTRMTETQATAQPYYIFDQKQEAFITHDPGDAPRCHDRTRQAWPGGFVFALALSDHGKLADPYPPGMADPPPAAAVGVVCGATAAETTGPSVPTVPSISAVPAVPAVATPTTMATAGRCEVWGERRDTDSNGTGKGEESFSLHGCVYSSENRPHGPRIDPAAYVQLNGLIKCV